jgi:PAS domain S-box-containing protein
MDVAPTPMPSHSRQPTESPELGTPTQAEAALATRTRQLEAVRAVAIEITREIDLSRLLGLITRRAKDLVGASMGMTRLWDDARQELVPFVWDGVGEWLAHKSLRLGEGVAGSAAQRCEGLIVNDFRHSPYASPLYLEHTTYTAVLAEPLQYREQLVGVLALAREDGAVFTLDDQEVLRLFAAQAAVAIQNARISQAAQTEVSGRHRTEAALRESEGRLRTIWDTVALGIVVIDPLTHTIVDANPTAAALIGAPRDRLVGKVCFNNICPADVGRCPITDLQQAVDNSERTLLCVDGSRRQIVKSVVPVLLDGRTHLLESFVDITARKESEEALRTRTAQMEALRTISAELTRELDLDRLLARIMERATALFGTGYGSLYLWDEAALVLVPHAWQGHGDWEESLRFPLGQGVAGAIAETRQGLIVNDFRRSRYAVPAVLAQTTHAAVLGEPLLMRERLLGVITIDRQPDTPPFTPADQALLRLFADQATIAIENARLFQEERQRREQLEAVRVVSAEIARELDLDRLLDLILRRAMELAGAEAGVIMLWDEAAQALFPRLRIGEFWAKMPVRPIALGEGIVGHVAQTRQELIINDYRAWAGARQIALAHTAITAALGEPLLYRDQLIGAISLVHTAREGVFEAHHGALLRLFADQAAIAIENARLFQAQQQSFGALQRAQEELVRTEKLRALGQLAAGVAHDLNNMLAAILGQTELLRLQVKLPQVQEALKVLYTAASDGAQVVRRLLEFGRQEPSRALISCELATLVDEALEITRPRWQDEAQEQGRLIEVWRTMENLPNVSGNPAEIREALSNLVLNAVDAMPTGGRLTISGFTEPTATAPETPSWVVLTVTDSGVGMTEEVRSRIFEPFFTTKGVTGTGLGLAVVYGIMERHGGKIAVASTPGQGTAFTLWFRGAETRPEAAAETDQPSAPGRRRILLIDDEEPVRMTIANLLRAVGHTVIEADGGAQGLACLTDGAVDLVITDLGMPKMTGWEVAQQVKATFSDLPVLLLTGWGEHLSDAAPGRGCVDRVLAKPIRLEELQGAIAKYTGSRA